MKRHVIPLSYNPIAAEALAAVLARYKDVHHNAMITDFEQLLGKVTGSPDVVALTSGTSAIHLALKILGVGFGDTVIAPTFTYIATVSPAVHLGAKCVFIDSEKETWNMDPKLLEKALKDLDSQEIRPKVILVAHTYGMPSCMDAILALANRYGIPVLEDAAESLGSLYKGKPTGTLGRMGIYSFNNNKVVTTYGGGAIVTKEPFLAQKARFLSAQARENLPYYEHHEAGFNYAMNPLSAACGLSQLPHLHQNIKKRRQIFETYYQNLAKPGIEFHVEHEKNYSNRWFSAVLFENKTQCARVTAALSTQGIETRPVWRPLHSQPMFKNAVSYQNGTADSLFESGLCLPSGNDLSVANQQLVIDVIKQSA